MLLFTSRNYLSSPVNIYSLKDPLLAMILCAPIERQDKGNLGQKGLSDNTKVVFGGTKDDGYQRVFKF